MKNSTSIFILGPSLNLFFLRLMVIFQRPKRILYDSFISKNMSKKDYEKFCWNQYDSNLKLRLISSAFEILDSLNFSLISNLNGLLPNNKENLSLYNDLQRKIYVEKIIHILLLLGIANIFSSQGEIKIILPSSYKVLYKNTLNHIKKNNKIINLHPNVKTIFLGFDFFQNIKIYFNSIAILFYFLINVRKVRKSSNKKYKIGLLSWNSAKKIDNNKERTGLNSVIPENINPEEVLIYSKNNVAKEYELQAKDNNYNFVNFSSKEIFKYSSLNDIFELLLFFKNINYKFIFEDYRVDPILVNEFPKIIYFYLQWSKFIKLYNFNISISYNDYSLSDLIRNKIFLRNNIECWGYAHSASDYYIHNNQFLYDPYKAFLSFTRRYFLLKDQLNFFRLSRVFSKKNLLIGPMFKNYNSRLSLKELNEKKIIVSIFPCSINDNTFNSKSAEKQFFSEIFKLIFNCSNEYFFIIKAKYNKLNLEKYYESDRLRNTFAKDKKFVFINPDIPSHKIINSSDAVISMAFTSPSIEAICKNKPAVFFDPQSLAYENHFKNIDGIYLNNISDLEIFIETIKDKEKTFKWVSEIKHEIHLNDKNQGIFDIHKDIENFFFKDNSTKKI